MSHCEILDVDGEPVRIQVVRPLTDEEREAMVEFIRWVRCNPLSCGQEPQGTPLATGTPVATHGPHTSGRIDLPPMPLPPELPADE